jgi:MFS family permease
LNAYLHVLRHRPLGLLLLASVLARLPQTINGLALVLFIRAETGSYGTAGAVAGGIALGMGAGAPFLGRVADRRGPGVLLPVAVAHAALLLTIVLVGGSAPAGVLVVVAVLAGAAVPPTPSVLRARLPVMLDDARSLIVPAYALDSVLVEISFVIGPLLTAVIVAVFDPTVALVLSAAAAVLGNATFLRLLPADDVTERAAAHGGWLGPLRSPAILTLVLTMLPFGVSIGALEVMLPAFSETEGAPELAGVLLAVWALGSAFGGLFYGARPWRLPVARVHLRLTLFYPLAFLPLLASGSVAWMAVLLLPAGALIAPIFASRNELAGLAAPRGTETEALTWPLTTLLCGISLGAAISGALVDAVDWQAAVLAAAGAALLAALLSAVRRRTLLDGIPAARTVATQTA